MLFKIFTLGPDLSYSAIATKKAVHEITELSKTSIELRPNIDTVISNFLAYKDSYALIPYSNIITGDIIENVKIIEDLLSAHKVTKIGNIKININHVLCGNLNSDRLPLDTESLSVYSHHEALRQCKEYLNIKLPHAQQYVCDSTSLAAKTVAKMKNSEAFAVCSKQAADHYKLKIIDFIAIPGVQLNETTFVIVKN